MIRRTNRRRGTAALETVLATLMVLGVGAAAYALFRAGVVRFTHTQQFVITSPWM